MAMFSALQTQSTDTASRNILLEQVGLNLYRENAFRITGLPVDASTKEIARHADKLKIMEELGQGVAAHPSAFALNPPPSMDQIREASRRLRDPEKRLIDEFFWFWPATIGNSASDPAMQALSRGDPASAFALWKETESNLETGFTATHNIAVMCHLMAVEWTLYQTTVPVDPGQGQETLTYWREALTSWKKIARSEPFWDAVEARIRAVDDLRLTIGFAKEMRECFLDALSSINAEAALEFAEQQQLELARTHVNFARGTQHDPAKFTKTAQRVLAPALTRTKQQIQSARQRAGTDPSEALIAGHELLGLARETLSLIQVFFGEVSEVHQELSDEVASVCNQLVNAYYNATRDSKACLAMLQTILPLVISPELRQQIERGIVGAELEPVYVVLKEIQDSNEIPSARLRRIHSQILTVLAELRPRIADSQAYIELCDAVAVVLRGISLAAWNEHQDRATAVSANNLALRHVRDNNIRQHLTNDTKVLSQMAAQRRANLVARLGCWGPIGIIVVLAVIGSFTSKQTSPSSSSTSYTQPSSTNSSQSGTYHIPSYRTAELNRDQQSIEAAKNQLQHLDWQLESLREEIEQDKLFLDNASQERVNAYNVKVDRYNSLLRDERSKAQAVNQMVDDYNGKLSRYSQ
jgi:hypothetical protein